MLSSDLVLTILFLAQTGIGFLGNAILLLLYVSVFLFQPHHKKNTDLILIHLSLANIMTLLTQAAPGMVIAFRWKNILDVVECQIIVYIRRVARGLSICTTCLLSVFQAITISPSTSFWAQFKPSAHRYILPSFLFFWIFNLLVEMNVIKPIVAIKNITVTINGNNRKCCISILRGNYLNNIAFLSAKTLRDLIFVNLMSGASGYMVTVLYQHHKQVQHIHSNSLTHRSSPETKASRTILLLVTCFVCFYCISSGINLALNFVEEDDLSLFDPVLFLGACYASLAPLVLIRNDPRIIRLYCVAL